PVNPRSTAMFFIGDHFSRTLHQPGGLSSKMAEMTDISEFESPLYRTALVQLDRVAARLDLESNIHERLRHPRRALVVSIPVRMDDGNTEVLRAYRLQHSTVLGPTERGLRYDPDINLRRATSARRSAGSASSSRGSATSAASRPACSGVKAV